MLVHFWDTGVVYFLKSNYFQFEKVSTIWKVTYSIKVYILF